MEISKSIMPSSNKSGLTEKQLRRLLTSRKAEDAARLRQWLASPPADTPDPVTTLADLAKSAKSTEERLS